MKRHDLAVCLRCGLMQRICCAFDEAGDNGSIFNADRDQREGVVGLCVSCCNGILSEDEILDLPTITQPTDMQVSGGL